MIELEMTEQIAIFLNNYGVGTFDPNGMSGNIFIHHLPDAPDESIAIYTTGGPGADPFGEYGRMSFQIMIRSIPNDPRLAEIKAQRIIDLLSGFNSGWMATGGNFVINTTAIQSGPSGIGPDQKHRFEFSQNFIIEYVK